MTIPTRDDIITEQRFCRLWQRSAERPAAADPAPVYHTLTGHYNQRWRRYHTLEHLCDCLTLFDQIRGRLQMPDAVELALWFHDVVYQPGASDNERRSADLFAELLGDAAGAALTERVDALIMATRHHDGDPAPADADYVVDIDLAGFAYPWARFSANSDRIRQEFAHLGDREFIAAQLNFMRRLQRRPRFFRTAYFQACCEREAQRNLRRHIERLEVQQRVAS